MNRIKSKLYAKNKKLKFWFNEVSVILSNKIRTLVNVEFKDKEALIILLPYIRLINR